MKHLVASITETCEIQEAQKQIRAAHDFLVEAARAMRHNHEHTTNLWGQLVKRHKVLFSTGEKPTLVNKSLESHSLAEIVNQCATMERMLDALEWASGFFSGYKVTTCHPTTGSARGKAYDHDIVLHGPGDTMAIFEVSDVASSRDGNKKEFKDVGALLQRSGKPETWQVDDRLADDRLSLFLVVSEELYERLIRKKHKYRDRLFHYDKIKSTNGTVIVRVHPGPRPENLASIKNGQLGETGPVDVK